MIKEREQNPIGKVFSFTKEELNFTKGNELIHPNTLYLCRNIFYTNEKMSMHDQVGDSKQSAELVKVSPDGRVDDKNPITVVSDFWHTEVRLLKECVVGEIDIEVITKIKYNVKKLPKKFELSNFLGRVNSKEESQELVDFVNKRILNDLKPFTIEELAFVFQTSPLTFKQIEHLEHSVGFDTDILEELNMARPEELDLESITRSADHFDFTIKSVQLREVKKMMTKRSFYHKDFNANHIIEILSKNAGLFFDSFDGTIDDTYARESLFEMADEMGFYLGND